VPHEITVLPATRQRRHSSLYPAEAGTRFRDPGGMQCWVDLSVSHASTDRARRRVTSFIRRTTLTTIPRRRLPIPVTQTEALKAKFHYASWFEAASVM